MKTKDYVRSRSGGKHRMDRRLKTRSLERSKVIRDKGEVFKTSGTKNTR